MRRAGARTRPPPSPRRVPGRATTPHDRRAARSLAGRLRAGMDQLPDRAPPLTPPSASPGPCTGVIATSDSTSTTCSRHRTASTTCSPRSTATLPASSGANPKRQDGPEGRRGPSIHYLKNPLQFADTEVGPSVVTGTRRGMRSSSLGSASHVALQRVRQRGAQFLQ